MPVYIKRRWSESRGDEYDHWGLSWWYFEVDSDGTVLRQLEQYDSGMILKYGHEHIEDEYGFLADLPLDLGSIEGNEITVHEFERAWSSAAKEND